MMESRWSLFPASLRKTFEELDQMRQQMDRLFEEIFSGEPFLPAGVFPLVNISEDNDNYYVRAELPGIKADDLDISVTADSLVISGERKIPEEENVNYHRREREGGKFNRILSLPGQIDPQKVEARYNNGILTVILPKTESSKPKKIAVKTE